MIDERSDEILREKLAAAQADYHATRSRTAWRRMTLLKEYVERRSKEGPREHI